MMCKTEVLIIDNKALEEYLDQRDQEDPERTFGPLDSMRWNLNKRLHNVLVGVEKETGIIEIDHKHEMVTIVGNEIQGDPKVIGPMNDEHRDAKLYHLFTEARDYAERIGMSEVFFRKIR